MFFAVINEMGPFIFMFAVFTIVFSLFQIILLSQVVKSDSEYPGVHPFIRMLIQTLRVSVGDLQVSNYSKWADDSKAEKL
jgi:hypothetical protein